MPRLPGMTQNTDTTTAICTLGHAWASPARDGYGRPVRRLYASHRGAWTQVAAITTLPQTWVDSHGSDRWMVSDLRREVAHTRPAPMHCTSMAKARAYAESLVSPLTEDELEGLRAYEAAVQAETDNNKLVAWAAMHAEKADDTDAGNLHGVMRRIVGAELNRRSR